MAESFTFNKEKCQQHLEKIIEFQNQFVGKRNHNPFLWIKKHVTPLYNRLVGIATDGIVTKPEETKELQDAILALPLQSPPIIDKTLTKEQAETQQPKIVMTPAGMMVQDDRPTAK